MNHNFSLAKDLSADSNLENSLVYLKKLQLNMDINFNSLSGDALVWSKYNDK